MYFINFTMHNYLVSHEQIAGPPVLFHSEAMVLIQPKGGRARGWPTSDRAQLCPLSISEKACTIMLVDLINYSESCQII